MKRNNALAAVSIALLSLGAASVAQAQVSGTVIVGGQPQYHTSAPVVVQYGPPPPPRAEVIPRARRGMAWVPGHWEWRGNRHVWTEGHWVKERPGYRYREARWVERDGRWELRPGGWDRDRRDHRRDDRRDDRHYGDRDRDGDGVRNRHDRDRDGDGVSNRHDRSPDNPYRR